MLHSSVFVTPLHRSLQSQLYEAQIFQRHNPDSHYCNSIYSFIKQGALKHSVNLKFFSADAKWKILVGESDFPLACVAHGKKAVVGLKELFNELSKKSKVYQVLKKVLDFFVALVYDHDFGVY